MKNAFTKETMRSITRSLGRFIAVGIIVALGTGFYAGLRMAAPDMRLAADIFYDETNLYDIRVLSTKGLSEENITALSDVEDVEAVMPACETDFITLINNEQYTVRMHSLDVQAARASDTSDGVHAVSGDSSYLNRPLLVSGSWPTQEGECVISAERIMSSPVQIGDTVEVIEGLQDIDATLKTRTFTVVGFVNASYYSSPANLGYTSLGSGVLQQYVYVAPENFVDNLPYTEAFITVKGARDAFSGSGEYKTLVSEAQSTLEKIVPEQEEARYRELTQEGQTKLDDARVEYEQEKKKTYDQLDEAKRQLDEAAATLAANEADLIEGQHTYDEGTTQLSLQRTQTEAQLTEAYQKLAAQQEQVNEKGVQLSAAKTRVQEAETAWQKSEEELKAGYQQLATMKQGTPEYTKLKADLDATAQELNGQEAALKKEQRELAQNESVWQQGSSTLAQAWTSYDAQKQETGAKLDGAQAQLDAVASSLAEGRNKLATGRQEYEGNLKTYEEQRAEADKKFAAAEKELDEKQNTLHALAKPAWYLMDRTKNIGAESFQSDAERIDHISQVFPLIFFLVAALVALTTMTRMVEEERIAVGTYKALGYSRARITSKYLIYALLASGVGSFLGIILLSQVLPLVVFKAYAIIYSIPTGPTPIDLFLAALSAGLGIGLTLLATWFAAVSTLKEKPAMLMLPRAPKPGKRIFLERITPFWRKISFSWKVTLRNIFRYKRRFIMTVIGIAGCTALLLTGLGLSDAVNDIITLQFKDVYHYNTSIRTDADISSEDNAQVNTIINNQDKVTAYTRVYEGGFQVLSSEGKEYAVSLMVPENTQSFSDFITLRERVSHQPLSLNSDTLIVCEKLADQLHLSLGDTLVLSEQDEMGNAAGERYTLTVGGITENYIGLYIYLSPEYYQKIKGEVPACTTILANSTTDVHDRQEMSDNLFAIKGVTTVGYNDETIESYQKTLVSVNSIVVVLVVAAMTLAFIVLYNLININITERKREIATLKVLGFIPREVDAYIYRETIILTILGALSGLVFGIFMENFVVVTAEVNAVMFGREIHPMSFVIAFTLTLAFSAFVAVVMRGKLNRIDMVESLKSVD